MKIKSDIKEKDLPSFVIDHLSFVEIDNVKWGSATFVIALYNFPLILSFLALMSIEFIWIMAPFILLLNIWCLRLLYKNAYSTQWEMIKFLGIYGIVGSITFLIMFQSISYYSLNIHSIMYYIIVNLVLIIIFYIIIRYQLDKYKEIHVKLKQGNTNQAKKYGVVIAVVPVIGLILGQFVGRTEVLKYYYVLGVNFFLMLLLFYIGVKFIHKYFFMKANMDYVIYQEPSKKEKAQLMKKGVEIK